MNSLIVDHKECQVSQYLTPGQGTHFQWIVEGQILLLDMNTEPGPDAFLYDQMVVDQCNFARHSIDLIVKIPPTQNATSLQPLMNFKSRQHPRLGEMIVVGLKSAMTTLRGTKMQSFETLEEAVSYLNRINH
jgi:hypothetical protein